MGLGLVIHSKCMAMCWGIRGRACDVWRKPTQVTQDLSGSVFKDFWLEVTWSGSGFREFLVTMSVWVCVWESHLSGFCHWSLLDLPWVEEVCHSRVRVTWTCFDSTRWWLLLGFPWLPALYHYSLPFPSIPFPCIPFCSLAVPVSLSLSFLLFSSPLPPLLYKSLLDSYIFTYSICYIFFLCFVLGFWSSVLSSQCGSIIDWSRHIYVNSRMFLFLMWTELTGRKGSSCS